MGVAPGTLGRVRRRIHSFAKYSFQAFGCFVHDLFLPGDVIFGSYLPGFLQAPQGVCHGWRSLRLHGQDFFCGFAFEAPVAQQFEQSSAAFAVSNRRD